MPDPVSIHIDDLGTATVTLNRPEAHNAFNGRLIEDLMRALVTLSENQEVRVVVLAAAGKSFSAGADLSWMRELANASEQENYADAMRMAELMRTLNGLPKPTLARIHGATYGGAVGLVACCDVAVAAQTAIFCLSEAKLGLVPAVISPYVVRAIGARAARRYFQSAERFNADEARRIGLVHEVVPLEQLDDTIQQLAAAIRNAGPCAQSTAKRLIEEVNGACLDDKLIQKTAHTNADMRRTEEGREGIAAFLEKRSPRWRK